MVDTLNIRDYTDINSITIDKAKPIKDRLEQYIIDIKNPYTVRVSGILVKIEFVGKNKFSDSLCAVFTAQ